MLRIRGSLAIFFSVIVARSISSCSSL